MQLTGNTVLITGGGSGIGRGLAEAFHAQGNTVIIAGRSPKKLDEATAANPGMKALTVDMTDAASIKALAEQATREYPHVNVLINMAGIMKAENLREQSDLSDAEATVTTNLLGPIRLTAALLPHLMEKPQATIINVTSGLAFLPLNLTPTYCATKAALHSYTESLRYQLKDTSVQVLELAPPYVATELMGDRQANDPNAMPLGEYIAEVMDLLKTQPDAPEILVQRVYPLRFAAQNGPEKYNEQFRTFNDAMTAARAAH